MLSVLFATGAYYTIKENNSKEESFCGGKLSFAKVDYHIAGENLLMQIVKKPILHQHFLAEAKKTELQRLSHQHSCQHI